MKKIKSIIGIISFAVLVFTADKVQAQKSFSRDSAKFIKEYSAYVGQINSEEIKREIKLFQEYWSTGRFDKKELGNINELANSMLLVGMKPDPYFLLLTKCLNAYVSKGLKKKVLADFLAISSHNLEKNTLGFKAFMQTCYPLFTANILVDNKERRWYIRDNNYTLTDQGGFSIQFVRSDLICKAPLDSMIIIGTSGTFYPNKQLWKGDKGKITWSRHGREDAYVEFGNYELDLKGSGIKVQNAEYTNKDFFSGKVKGVFEDRVSYSKDTALIARSIHPSFSTYDAKVEIKNLVGKDARYYGGITVKGEQIYSQSFGDKPATIELLFKGKPKVIVKSSTFKISSGSVASQGAEIFVLMDSGKIYHPKAIFNYNFEKKNVFISRGKEGLTRANFLDDYHNMEYEVDNIYWKQEEPFIELDNLSNDKPAIIESLNYYREFKYDKIQGMLRANPIETMLRFAIKKRTKDIYLPDYARYRKNEKKNMMIQVYDLADGGFIRYNPKTDSIHIEMKMFNYYYANKGVKDYDIIRLNSVIAARSNATLNLLNDEVTVQGVRRFNFSDSQNVIAAPTEQTVIIKGNRTLAFGGMIRAGRFDLFSKEFVFDYEKFATLPTTIDSMRLYYPDEQGKMKKVNSVLSNLYGVLEIDKPNNKSGLKDFPEYPIFRSEKGSEVTYDKPTTHGGAYKADDFKFIVDPFEIDSLDNFTVEGLQFNGTFVSADIFPEFRYSLSIQEDFSLGFKKSTPPSGYSMYKGKGKGIMDISLSNEGLYGSGSIVYSGTTIESESFLLLPNKTVAKANKFTVPQDGKYPAVVGANLGTTWNPYEDNMSLATSNADATMKVFKMGYDFKGEMNVTPGALKGNGLLAWSEAEFTSTNMVYKPNGVTADTGAIKIFAADTNKIAFNSNNLKSNIDFTKREGKFTANNVNDLTYLPFNQYGSNMNDYKWNMDDKTIDINIGNMGGVKPYFVATKPGMDSLKFEAKHALFDIKTGVLAIDEIPYIDVADSRVFPSDGKAIVRENAEMDTLYDSKIDANRVDKYHQFFSCKTKIRGKNQLRANGQFNYENKHGKQQVFFDSIYAHNKILFADALVEKEENFVIDRMISYKGIMRVKGNSKLNHLFGYIMPQHGFDSFNGKWVRYRDSIDRNNVILRIGIPKDKDKRTIPVGIYAYGRGTGYYPQFYGWKKSYTDVEVIGDTGLLYYDYAKKLLVMGNEDKLFKGSMRGNTMTIDPVKGYLYSEGRLNFGFDYKESNIRFGGNASFQKEDSTFTFNVLNMIQLPIPKEVTDQINKMAVEAGGTGADVTSDFVTRAYASTLEDDKTAAKALNKLKSSKKFVSGNDAQGLLVFRVEGLRYVPRERALFSRSTIDLFQVGDNAVNTQFDCMYEIKKKRSGDGFTLYVEFTGNDWLFLSFVRGVLYVATSDAEFNKTIPILAEKYATENFSMRMGTSRTLGRFQDRYFDH